MAIETEVQSGDGNDFRVNAFFEGINVGYYKIEFAGDDKLEILGNIRSFKSGMGYLEH